MPDSMRYRLNDERWPQMDKLREELDGLPDERWKADVLDAALTHLEESIENADDLDLGEVPPDTAKKFQTSVVRYQYRTRVETRAD